ncbi:three-helix bundle dimerization domain-containing protein [Streptomyces angustmyceticus]|uniref:three-helix bundle dimerization domain-containing protein n=1 Tax=Streptomyces angustmyceticus TaxID=285578 RepID=UPI003D8CA9CF
MAINAREEEAIQAVVERLTDAYHTTRTRMEIEAAVTEAHTFFKARAALDDAASTGQ